MSDSGCPDFGPAVLLSSGEPGMRRRHYMAPRVAHEFTHRLADWLAVHGYESFDIKVARSGLLTRLELSLTGVDREGQAKEEFEIAIVEARKAVLDLGR